MLELHQAHLEELIPAEALWSQVFGDDAAFQRDFYALTDLSGPLVLTEDGQVQAMLALPEVTLTFPDGWSVKGGYVYALATHPEGRGRGYAGLLLRYACEILRKRQADCVLTVPAQPSLFSFFAKNGFAPAFRHRRVTARPAAAPARPISPEAYDALRESLLASTTHVVQGPGQMAFQQRLCPHPGSGLYRLELAHGPGCAAVECWPGAPVVKELLCDPLDEGQGAAAAAALCGGPAQVRLPAFGEEDGQPFGAIQWLYGAAPSRWRLAPWGYLGLAFD